MVPQHRRHNRVRPVPQLKTPKDRHASNHQAIRNCLLQYGPESCCAAIVTAWCIQKGIRPGSNAPAILQALEEKPPPRLAERLLTGGLDLQMCFQEISQEISQEIGQEIHSPLKTGSIYTPRPITDQIIRYSLEAGIFPSPPSLIDPACGAGAFLTRAGEIISQEFHIPLEETIQDLIHGADINPRALQHARIALEASCLESGRPPPGRMNLHQRDSLLENPGSTFSLVATNPPYIRTRDLRPDYRAQLLLQHPHAAQGNFSTATLFLITGYQMLAPGGVLGCITLNNFPTSRAAQEARKFIQERQALHTLIDFGHQRVFQGASAYTCLLFLKKDNREQPRFTRATPEQMPLLQARSIPRAEPPGPGSRQWRLTTPEHRENIRTLEHHGTPLGSLARIRSGFATLMDRAFIVGPGEVEPEITVPIIRVPQWDSKMVIQPYRYEEKKWVPIQEDEMRRRFPRAHRHLLQFREQLERRDRGRHPFHLWGRKQGMTAPGPKLLTPTYSQGPRFRRDDSGSLFCNGYSITPRNDCQLFARPLSIELLQIILNSRIMEYYACTTSQELSGGFQRFGKNNIKQFAIPTISSEQEDEILKLRDEMQEQALCEIFRISRKSLGKSLGSGAKRRGPEQNLSGIPGEGRRQDR